MKAWLLIPALIVLAACGGGSGGATRSTVEQPVSQQVAQGDERNRAKVHVELGSMYFRDGRFGVALEEANVAIDADPTYAGSYNLKGLVNMYLGENAEAEREFRNALRYAPNDPEINNNYGWFLCQTGKERQALSYFATAMKNPLYETPGKPLTNAGMCSLRIKDDKAAEDYLQKALRIDRANDRALFWLAEIAYRAGRLTEARQRLSELHKLVEPNSESTWLALLVERKSGDREAEARWGAQLRRKFQGTPEHQKLMQGQYE